MSRWLVRFSGGIIVLALGQGMVFGQITVGGNGANTTDSSASSTCTGPTNISGGTLQVGNGGTPGTLGSGNVTNNASLVFNRSDSLTVGNVISGAGQLVQAGTGTTTRHRQLPEEKTTADHTSPRP